MSISQTQARVIPPIAGFGRFAYFLKTLFEVLVDAQRQAAAAQKRFPFAEW
jgi:hypothetical protein